MSERITLYIDVRRPEEFAAGHLPGAKNVDLEAGEAGFVETIKDLVTDHDVILYCQSSFRSSYAQAMLDAKHGIVVRNFDGGLNLYQGELIVEEYTE